METGLLSASWVLCTCIILFNPHTGHATGENICIRGYYLPRITQPINGEAENPVGLEVLLFL